MRTNIPKSWTESTFYELNQFDSRTIDPAQFPDEKFELYSVPSFAAGKPEYSEGAAIGSTKQAVEPNDVLVCKINPRINRVWQVGVAQQFRQMASSEWIGFRTNVLNAKFYRYYFISPNFRELICTDVTGVGGSLTRAQPKNVATFPVPVAPLAEQKRIADKLDAVLMRVDACRDRLNRIPGILKRFRQAVLAAATSGQLTKEWRADLEVSMSAWESTTFEAVCEEITVGYVGKMSSEYRESGVPFLRSLNVRPFRFDPDELRFISPEFHQHILKSALKPGDVVVVRTGAPGQCCVIPVDTPESNCSDLVIVRPGPYLMGAFACVYINSETTQAFVRSEQVGVAQAHFNVGSMKRTPLTLPPVEEQIEIVRCVDSLFAHADRLEAFYNVARNQVEELTSATLSKAFRGALVPQDPNDEPASALLERLRATPPTVPIKIKTRKGTNRPPKIRKTDDAMFTWQDISNTHFSTPRKDRAPLSPITLWSESTSTLLERFRVTPTAAPVKVKSRTGIGHPIKTQKAEVIMFTRKDISDTHLSAILKERGPLSAKALWIASQLEIDEFYEQLKEEETKGLLKEVGDAATTEPRMLEAIA